MFASGCAFIALGLLFGIYIFWMSFIIKIMALAGKAEWNPWIWCLPWVLILIGFYLVLAS